nr:LD-carboxypeptidase [Pseudobdellovibrionaceae bacterium]
SLHIYLNQKWKWPSLHASLLDRLGQGKVPLDIQNQLKDLLFGKIQKVEIGGLKPMNTKAQKVKTLSGSIVGGNLTVLQSSLGTPFQVDLKKKFLFIEDLGERGYRVDRMLEHFRQAGIFKECLGLLVGEFQGGNEPQTESSKVLQVLERFAADNFIPVWIGVPAGHGVNQWPLFFQTEAKIRVQDPKSLSSTFSLEIQSFGENQLK